MISSGNVHLDVLDGDDDNFSDLEISLREDSDAEGAGCSGGDDRSPARGLEDARSPANGTLRNYGDRDQSCSRQGSSGHATSPKSQSGCGNNRTNSAAHSSTTSKPPSSGGMFPFQDVTSVVAVRCAICGSPRSSRVVLESLHQSEDEVAKRARNRTSSSSSSRAPATCSSAADGRNKKVLVVVAPPVQVENYKVNDRDYQEQKTNDDDVPQAVARCVFCEKPICAECVHSFNCNSPLDCCFPARRWKTNVYCGFCYVAERERRIRRHIQGQVRQSRPSTLSTRNGASAL